MVRTAITGLSQPLIELDHVAAWVVSEKLATNGWDFSDR
jgi:hypothetical protein